MKRSNWPYLQKDEEGNLILYPATFFIPTKGYIIPDEGVRKTLLYMHIPVIFFAYLLFIHTSGLYSSIIVFSAFIIAIYVMHYRFFKRYTVSRKQFSFKEYFDDRKRENSNLYLCFIGVIYLICCVACVKYLVLSGVESDIFIGIMGITAFGIFSVGNIVTILR